MTLRIFVEARSDGGVVALHGRLSAAEVAEVERAVDEEGPSRVDLSHLTGVDEGGLQALRRLQESGTPLEGASPYVRLLLGTTAMAGEGETRK